MRGRAGLARARAALPYGVKKERAVAGGRARARAGDTRGWGCPTRLENLQCGGRGNSVWLIQVTGKLAFVVPPAHNSQQLFFHFLFFFFFFLFLLPPPSGTGGAGCIAALRLYKYSAQGKPSGSGEV